MNKRILVGAVAVVLGAVAQVAPAHDGRDRDGDRYEYDHDRGWGRDRGLARVVDVSPVVERVRYSVPVQRCWNEAQERGGYRGDPAGAAIVGGAIGAIVGHGLGRGEGRGAATVGGAMVGAVLGSQLARDDGRRDYGPRYADVQRCRTDYEERWDERVVGYRVSYVYWGGRGVTRLAYNPGGYVRLSDVHPYG